MIPVEAPEEGQDWKTLMDDIELVVMPGTTNPQLPDGFQASNSYPSIVGDILNGAISCIDFSWNESLASTELEMSVMDWLCKALNLPSEFLYSSPTGKGGGVFQNSASEATLVAMLTACALKVREDEVDKEMLVAYCSAQAHPSVERAGMLAGVQIRLVQTDQNFSLRGTNLKSTMDEDMKMGLTPFCVVATLGTTNTCAFDNLIEIGQVCRDQNVWLHVDAAYAGSAFICPEFRPLLDGAELVDSFAFSPNEWMLVNYDCTVMFVKDSSRIVGRQCCSLKLWFLMRLYGLKGLRRNIRNHVVLATEFAECVRQDDRLELLTEPRDTFYNYKYQEI